MKATAGFLGIVLAPGADRRGYTFQLALNGSQSFTATATPTELREKAVTPHVLRHTAAMRLLHAGVDTTVIALWLGHEQVDTTHIYLQADLTLKEQALAKTTPADVHVGRYRPPDTLLAFLEAL